MTSCSRYQSITHPTCAGLADTISRNKEASCSKGTPGRSRVPRPSSLATTTEASFVYCTIRFYRRHYIRPRLRLLRRTHRPFNTTMTVTTSPTGRRVKKKTGNSCGLIGGECRGLNRTIPFTSLVCLIFSRVASTTPWRLPPPLKTYLLAQNQPTVSKRQRPSLVISTPGMECSPQHSTSRMTINLTSVCCLLVAGLGLQDAVCCRPVICFQLNQLLQSIIIAPIFASEK